uniref:Secreted protein n=1 Tax=Sus scrofa TaxID=9823 RepID=A0A8W4FBA7_PIG
MMCLGVGLFGFSLFGALCASCILNPVSFRFGKFPAIISSNIFSIPLSFSTPSGIPIMRRLARFILSHRSHIAFQFFDSVFCLLTRLSDFHYSIFHITDSFFCIIHSGFYCP